jgi:hypothetical protein
MRKLSLSGLVILSLIMIPTHSQPNAGHQAPGRSGATNSKDERFWRGAFEQVHRGLATVDACRGRLTDYCSWERLKSREESEVRAFRDYLDAKRRGEDVKDPLEGKVYVPKECQKLFEGYPEEVTPRPDPDAPDSCLTRVTALIDAIDEVASYWEQRREELEREARQNAVPMSWRQ